MRLPLPPSHTARQAQTSAIARIAIALVALIGVALTACAPSATNDPVLAMRVNGTPVTLSSYQQVLSLLDASAALQGNGTAGINAWQSPSERQTLATAKSQTVSFFTTTALLKQQLDAQGITVPDADIAAATAQLNAQVAQAQAQSQAAPSNTGLKALVQAATPDAIHLLAEQQAYTVALATKGSVPTVHAYGILLKSASDARTVLAAVKSGQDFGTLARTHSLDAASASNGGDLGTVYPGQFAAAFDTAVFKNLRGDGDIIVNFPTGFGVFRINQRSVTKLSTLKNSQNQEQVVTAWVTNVLTPEANVQVYVK